MALVCRTLPTTRDPVRAAPRPEDPHRSRVCGPYLLPTLQQPAPYAQRHAAEAPAFPPITPGRQHRHNQRRQQQQPPCGAFQPPSLPPQAGSTHSLARHPHQHGRSRQPSHADLAGKEGRGAPTREMEGVLQASDSRAAGAPRSAQLPAAGRVGTGREGGDDSRTKGGAVAEAAAPSSSRRAAANAELREVLLMTCQALQASRGGRGARPGWALMMGQRTGAFEACMSRERLGGRTRCSGRSASGAQQHAEDSDLAVTTPCLHSWAAPTMCPVQLKGSHPIQPSSIPHPSAAPALLPVGPKLCPDGVATESWGGLHNTAGVIPSGREDTPGAEMRKRQGAMAGCGPGEHVGRRGRV
ncbi:MAG: hypothetical protein WDW38_009005 [Sanguina aurantia]